MPGLKEVRSRITSVISTQQITKAMKMVSAAKLRKSQDAIIQLRPYAQKLDSILGNINQNVSEQADNVWMKQRAINSVLLIIISSDRGLCGAFNSNVSKGAYLFLKEAHPDLLKAGKVNVMALGKKEASTLLRENFKRTLIL